MSHYGVQRLVIINSGRFSYAELDLSKPVHLAAPNNRGKSTLVNALQFLYVDQMDAMRFGNRTQEDTCRHYFGPDRSYLVFECATPSGIQCLLVRGLGNLRGARFERYVYEHEYRRADYADEQGVVVDFDLLRSRLADRRLVQVRNTELWQVLAGQNSDGGKDLPRLGLLPLRKHEEYRSFRDVFVKLLMLTNVDARTLKQLVIACHARHIGERRIDIVADYKDEFERAERSEQQLGFIRSAAALIDRGRTLRAEIKALIATLAAQTPPLWAKCRDCHQIITHLKATATERVGVLRRQEGQIDQQQRDLMRKLGGLETERQHADAAVKSLHQAHRKWSPCTPEMVSQMRDNADALALEIAQLKRNLAQAEKLDLVAMRRQIAQRERMLQANQRALRDWDGTVAAALLAAGMPEDEVEAVFRVLNPALVMLVIGDGVTVRDRATALKRLRAMAGQVRSGRYVDDAIEVRLAGLPGPDVAVIHDRIQLGRQIELVEADLKSDHERLKVAEDQANAQKALAAKLEDYAMQSAQLREYDEYVTTWAARSEIEGRLRKVDEALAEAKLADARLAEAKRETLVALADLQSQSKTLDDAAQHLRHHADRFRQESEPLGLSLLPDADARGDDGDRRATPEHTVETTDTLARSLAQALQRLESDAKKAKTHHRQLQEVQSAIMEQSRQFQGQMVYFSEAESDWEELIERRAALADLEVVAGRNWDNLFKTLAARLHGIKIAVKGVEQAVQRINRGLATYKVSNLQAVQIKPEKEHDTFALIDTLTSQDGIFQNPGEIDTAKKHLRNWIADGKTIELESLFDLQIQRQENDGTWITARSLDEIGSTGTGMTAKAMVFIQLIRAIVGSEKYRLHFYLDETGKLDPDNLRETTRMAVSKGVVPITAEPDVRLEPLAHPVVTVYTLGQDRAGLFCVDRYRTYHAQRLRPPQPAQEATRE